MNKEIINSHIDAILEEISEPINHNFDTLEELNDRVDNIENIIEDSSLEYNCLYDISDKLDDVINDVRSLEDDYETLSNIGISHDSKEYIDSNINVLRQEIKRSKEGSKRALQMQIDNLSSVIDGLFNGNIRLPKPQNKLVGVILKLSQNVRNIVRVGLAKLKGINKRMMERANKTS